HQQRDAQDLAGRGGRRHRRHGLVPRIGRRSLRWTSVFRRRRSREGIRDNSGGRIDRIDQENRGCAVVTRFCSKALEIGDGCGRRRRLRHGARARGRRRHRVALVSLGRARPHQATFSSLAAPSKPRPAKKLAKTLRSPCLRATAWWTNSAATSLSLTVLVPRRFWAALRMVGTQWAPPLTPLVATPATMDRYCDSGMASKALMAGRAASGRIRTPGASPPAEAAL